MSIQAVIMGDFKKIDIGHKIKKLSLW